MYKDKREKINKCSSVCDFFAIMWKFFCYSLAFVFYAVFIIVPILFVAIGVPVFIIEKKTKFKRIGKKLHILIKILIYPIICILLYPVSIVLLYVD